ncbi:FAD-dependent oxidoreductase [Streptosporangium sp. NBC_01755]|uniref:oxidoreductase n=1 Tax=unclassified Streptosporangium TaxID=2632669 RepID=UPI002DDBA4F8|nr:MULTISPECIES: FAD-dependent oxidoreductase [unclassified Streptosporangium]WSA27688.1 FAD-dependent oxidoreductase [Streptosporangium sp. NBC_01810]WSD00838.1 FAD-dependent oxidoreductase [Streptosporangium sp. NBC_01755]
MPDPGPLFSPVRLGPVSLRNRVFVPGHTTNFGLDNRPTARHTAYHLERARGGVGLIITEAVRVHPTSAGRHISLGSFDDSSIPAYAEVAEAVHAEGARIFAQIMHAGRQASGDATRTAAWSAADVPWAAGAHVPHAMGHGDIATVVDAFGAAAHRMAQAGYDGVEVHLGHGHLLQQFLSPVTNTRTDGYGGDLDGRLRLTREVLASVTRQAPDLPVGLRISADEFLPGGLTPQDMLEVVGLLRGEFPLVYVHVSHSAYHGSYSLATQMADMSFGHAPFRHHAALFKWSFPDLAVLAVCRLDSLPEAVELVTSGEADLVGLARPHIADPHLVRKAMEGRSHESRSCLACNQGCIGRLESSLPISCVVNPEVGAEREWRRMRAEPPLAGARPRRVLVVGGGPAGMEAALSARRAGHEVTLAEAGPELGGQVAIAARVPGRERLALLTSELSRDVATEQITILLGHRVEAADLLAGGRHEGVDDVIVATGSRPRRRELPGGPPVFDLWQAVASLDDPASPLRGTVVVRDDEGAWPAASIAEHLAGLGAKVHLLSPTASLSARITTYSRLALTHRFGELGVKVHPLRVPQGVEGGLLTLRDTLCGDVETLPGVTAIVDAGTPTAVDELYRELDALSEAPRVHVVGDANAPRTALEAVYEGRLAGTFLTDAVSGATALARAH